MKSTIFDHLTQCLPGQHLEGDAISNPQPPSKLRKAVVGETVLHQGCEGDHCGAHQEEVGDAWRMGKPGNDDWDDFL